MTAHPSRSLTVFSYFLLLLHNHPSPPYCFVFSFGPPYRAVSRKSGTTCAHLTSSERLFFEKSPKLRSLLSIQHSTTIAHDKQWVAAVEKKDPPVGSLPIEKFQKQFVVIDRSRNRPFSSKPICLPNRLAQHYSRPQQLAHPRAKERAKVMLY